MVDPSPNNASPCVGCGLCCNGVLHWGAKASVSEVDLLLSRGHELTEIGGRKYFSQPCLHEVDRGCSIYLDRYEVCRKYKCGLLRRYESGEIALKAAQQQIKTAYDLLETVTDSDPSAKFLTGRRERRTKLAGELKSDRSETEAKTGIRLLNIIALDLYLERWFLNKSAKPSNEAG